MSPMKMRQKSRKAISPVVVISLLMLSAIIGTIALQNSLSNLSTKISSHVESSNDPLALRIDASLGSTLFINYDGADNLSVDKVTVDGNVCTFSENISSGSRSINISSCAQGLGDSRVEVIFHTNKGLYRESTFLKGRVAPQDTFTPDQISTLSLWLDAQDTEKISTNEGEVTHWFDKTGNNHTAVQGSSSLRPLYVNDGINGNPSIRFDGNDDHMLGNISLTQPITGFFVVNVSSESIIFDGRPQRALYLITLWSSTEIRLWSGSDESPLITPSGAVSTGEPQLITTLTHHDQQSGIWVNGTEIVRGNTGSNSHEGYWIGNDDGPYATSGPGHYLDGDVGEILIYEAPLNATLRSEIESYLKEKWELS